MRFTVAKLEQIVVNPKNGWFIVENPIKHGMIWGYPYFLETPSSTPQKSNIDKSQKLPCLKGSYLFQTMILGIHVSSRGCMFP